MSSATPPSSIEDKNERLSIFDSYVCTEPAGDLPLLMHNGPDEYTGLLRTLQRSAEYFSERDQKRLLERIYFEQALLHMQHENWKHAMRILLPLWQRLAWRKAGWWILLKEVDRALEECARHVQDVNTINAVQWELLHSSLTSAQEHDHPFSKVVKDVDSAASRPKITLRAENIISSVSVAIAFTPTEAHVGIPLPYQLVLKSHTRLPTPSLHIEYINIVFEGTFRAVILQHDASITDAISNKDALFTLQEITLKEEPSKHEVVSAESSASIEGGLLHGKADLSLPAGTTRILCLSDIPREPGDIMASKVTVSFKESNFDLEVVTSAEDQLQQNTFFREIGDRITHTPVLRPRSSTIRVLPKPPKLRLAVTGINRDLFVDETLTLSLDVINDEDEEVELILHLQSPIEGDRGPSVHWGTDDTHDQTADDPSFVQEDRQKLAGRLQPSASQTHDIALKTGSQISEHILQIKATYFLQSDPKTQIFVALEKELIVHRPFECTHRFSPSLHTEEWPGYFQLDEPESGKNQGLTHRYLLNSQLMTIANLNLLVENVEVEVLEVQEAAHCDALPHKHPEAGILAPGDVKDLQFVIDVQKTDIEDRRPTYVDLRLKVRWRPDMPNQPSMITYHSVPELAIPFGEPRVLATAGSVPSPSGAMKLSYMIENPSVYNLQFNVMMEVSEDFAFSGSKNFMLQLLPLSRKSIDFLLLPLVRGTWISPQLRVFDTVFRKQLKVQGAEGVRNDKKGGISIWIDAPD